MHLRLKDEMQRVCHWIQIEASLADATAAEEKVIGIFDALIAAKERQINADTAAIESKIERNGNLGPARARLPISRPP